MIASSSKSALQSLLHQGRCVRIAAPARTLFSLPDITKLAGLSPALKASTGIETDGDEQRFHARKILPYSQSQLYSLVSDVPSYSSFIPFCHSSTVLAPVPPGTSSKQRRIPTDWKPNDEPFEVDAELRVGFGGLEERYISRVIGKPFESVTATASEQTPLFNSLVTTWSFSPASSLSPHASNSLPKARSPSQLPNATASRSTDRGPTLLTIDLAFSFANPLHRIASQAVLPRVADKMVEAFEKRCLEVWGKGKE
ncbi:dehydrase and lipid transport-domain-containing protein [Papiliotrema laurentii]|uniref:Dehydrase and lipid transport-domain-containing protein n=1 Tax=Papiliotrema laurentii TaxID=5418 RepID=A0AAD9FNP8_PAPLA|nr:dehydrase and lipid transport-domain-containing protein [Papiliotrema laurentii]